MPPPLFLRPSRPSLPRHPVASPPPQSLLILDCSCLPPFHSVLWLLRHPHYYSLSGAPLYLSSPNVFVAVFSRDSSPFAVCPCIASSLPRVLRTKRTFLSALPGSVLTSVLLFLQKLARLLSRASARAFCFAIIPCFLHILCSTILFSLPSRFPASQFLFPVSSNRT